MIERYKNVKLDDVKLDTFYSKSKDGLHLGSTTIKNSESVDKFEASCDQMVLDKALKLISLTTVSKQEKSKHSKEI